MGKKGYILVVTTIIIAIVLSGLLYATSLWLRTHALESVEITQREIALYVAQYGINQMIYNLNTGVTYSNGQSIIGTTESGYSYTATYYTPDTFGGTAYIKGTGTVGSFTRTIFASVVGSSGTGQNNEAFKYCMYTGSGGKDGLTGNDSTYFSNLIYPGYFYNNSQGALPVPDWNWYSNPQNYDVSYSSSLIVSITFPGTYNGKVLYVHYLGTDSSATLTINVSSSSTFSTSLITDYPNVVIQGSGQQGATWSFVTRSGFKYPVILHYPSSTSGSLSFNLIGNDNITLNGFLYTKGNFSITYSAKSRFTLNGMLMASSLGNLMPGSQGTFKINYTTDYLNILNQPPHFSFPSGYYYLTGSYREEY